MAEIVALGTVRPKWFGVVITCPACHGKFRLTSTEEIHYREGANMIWISCPLCARHGATFSVDLSSAERVDCSNRRCNEP